MIDLELERKAFNDWHFLTYGEFVNWWDDAPASWIHNDRWKGWISCAESKQAEIDSLRAQLAKFKENLFELRDDIDLNKYQVCNFDSDKVFSELEDIQFRIETMIEAAQENSHE